MMRARGLPVLLLVACGGNDPTPPPAAGVVHLDPRLEDGRSPGAVLASEPEVVRAWDVAEPDDVEDAFAALEPWTFENSLGQVPGPATGGLRIRAADYRPEEGVVHALMRLEEELDTATVDRVEVEVQHANAGSAVLTWRTAEPVAGVPPGALRAETVTEGDRPETLVFDLAGHPGWRGTATELVLYPRWRGAQSYELTELRFVRGGFASGDQPSGEHGGSGGDGGLLGFAGDLRRTWPAPSGEPLFDTATVPRGGRVVVEVGLPGRLHDRLEPAHFALDVKVEGEWRERARRSLVPGRLPERARWHGLVADLADLAGREVELRFRARIEGDPGRGRPWWGNPLLIGEPPADRRPDVLLVTLDTLRTDAVGCYGGSDVTPFLDELAEESLVFENAWAACNSTLPSHTSLLTGLPVPTHGVLDNRSTLAGDVRTLAQSLRAAGYHTAAAVSVEHLQAGWSGLGRGFDQYLDVQPGASTDGAATVERVIAWNEAWAAQGDRPVFLWLHLFDPHTPYGPPRPYLEAFAARRRAAGDPPPSPRADPPTIGRTGYTKPGKFLEGVTNGEFARFLYEASVAYTDELVRDVVWSWRETGRWPRTLCAVTADHGESFGERGVYYAHQLLHTPVMQVPLLLRVPEGPRGRVEARAWNPDLVRTLTGHLGLEELAPGGRDLLTLADREDERRVWFVHSGLDQVGCRDDDVHYWHNRHEYLQLGRDRAQPAGLDFLFRHRVDPGLLRNLADVEPELAARYATAMRAWMARADSGERVEAELTGADEARLEEMGYGGGGD